MKTLYSMTPDVWDAWRDADGTPGGKGYGVETSDAVTAPADGKVTVNVTLRQRRGG